MRLCLNTRLLLGFLAAVAAHGAFPGRNGEIAFTRITQVRDGQRREIYHVDPSAMGPSEQRLTRTRRPGFLAFGSSRSPAFSPNGALMAFASDGHAPEGTPGSSEIHLTLVEGARLGRGTWTTLEGVSGHAGYPAWAPDGAHLAFLAWAPGRPEYGEVRVLSLGGEQVLVQGILPQRPAWSPDGTRLAVIHQHQLWLISVNTRIGQQLTRPGAAEGFPRRSMPAWSPDGHRLAFAQRDQAESHWALWIMDADGSRPECLVSGAFDSIEPEWSPDGTLLAYASNRTGNFEIYTCAPMPTGMPGTLPASDHRLTHSPTGGASREPSWRALAPKAEAPMEVGEEGDDASDAPSIPMDTGVPLQPAAGRAGGKRAQPAASVASDATTVPMETYVRHPLAVGQSGAKRARPTPSVASDASTVPVSPSPKP